MNTHGPFRHVFQESKLVLLALLPEGLQRLYIAIDRDPAGQRAAERLTARATEAGIAVRVLEPRLGDFNDDLRAHGAEALRQHLAQQIDLKDQHRLTI